MWLAESLKKPSTSEEHQKALEFLREEKYLKRYRMTLMFLAQQLAREQGVDGLSALLSKLEQEPIEIFGLQHLLLKLHVTDSFLMALDDACIDDFCQCEAVVQLIDVSLSVLKLRDTVLLSREFGALLRCVILQSPSLFAIVPEMFRCLTEKTMVRNTVRYGVFREVIKAAKRFPRHLKRLVEKARDDIRSVNSWDRNTGVNMLRELHDCAPQPSADLLSLCETLFLDKASSGQRPSLQAVIGVLTNKKDISSELLPLLEKTIANPNRFARQAVMEAIGSLACEASEYCSRILLLIRKACEDEDEDVCREALSAMRHFVPEETFQVADLIPVVERLAYGKNEEIRRETIKTIECMGRKSPQVWTLLLPICQSMCSTDEACVRRDAVEMAGRLAAYIPPLQSDLLPLIKAGCTDQSAVVRVAGLWAIKVLAARSSENANDMLHTAVAGYEDENEFVRRTAMEAISRLASASHLSEDIMSLVKKGCLDEDVHVRLWAVDALGQLSSVAPHLSEDILALLRERCFEANHHVRQWSMEAVRHLASAAPNLSSDILPLARTGCSDGEEHVRLWALKTVSRLAEADPQLSENLMPLLRDVDVSEDTHMMNRANEAVRAVSPETSLRHPTLEASRSECVTDRPVKLRIGASYESMLEFEDILREAIETKHLLRVHQAASRILYKAVTLEKSKRSGYDKVILHLTNKRAVGEYSVQQLNDFLSSVDAFLNRIHGGLLKTLRRTTTK